MERLFDEIKRMKREGRNFDGLIVLISMNTSVQNSEIQEIPKEGYGDSQ